MQGGLHRVCKGVCIGYESMQRGLHRVCVGVLKRCKGGSVSYLPIPLCGPIRGKFLAAHFAANMDIIRSADRAESVGICSGHAC